MIGSREFERWWKRYWGARGKYGEMPRKEIALAAWNEALRTRGPHPPAGWTDPAPPDVGGRT